VLIGGIKLCVGFLHQWHPELSRIKTVAVEWTLLHRVIGNLGVYDNVLPLAVLEEAENGKAVLDAILDDQVVEQLGPCGKHTEGAKQPAVAQDALLHVSRLCSSLLHLRLVIRADLLWTLPLDFWEVLGVIGEHSRVLVETFFIGREVWVSIKGLVFVVEISKTGGFFPPVLFFIVGRLFFFLWLFFFLLIIHFGGFLSILIILVLLLLLLVHSLILFLCVFVTLTIFTCFHLLHLILLHLRYLLFGITFGVSIMFVLLLILLL